MFILHSVDVLKQRLECCSIFAVLSHACVPAAKAQMTLTEIVTHASQYQIN